MRQKDREQLKREIREELRGDLVRSVTEILETAFEVCITNFEYEKPAHYGTDTGIQISEVSAKMGSAFSKKYYELLSKDVERFTVKYLSTEKFIDDIVERIRRKQLT